MQRQRSHTITPHRLARLTAWLLALLVWFACGGGGPTRHHRRYGRIGIVRLRDSVRNIILLHAAQFVSKRTQRKSRITPRGGLIVRRRNFSLRIVTGSWLRRRLSVRGSFVAQVTHLIAVLLDWRKLAIEFGRRRRNGLTRLISFIPAPALSARLHAFGVAEIRLADTS